MQENAPPKGYACFVTVPKANQDATGYLLLTTIITLTAAYAGPTRWTSRRDGLNHLRLCHCPVAPKPQLCKTPTEEIDTKPINSRPLLSIAPIHFLFRKPLLLHLFIKKPPERQAL